jgi:hypothetical protein
MSTKFIAIVLAAMLAAAGVLAFSNSGSKSQKAEFINAPDSVVPSAQAAETDPIVNTDAYLGDFKSGYADGFNSGVAAMSYPDQSSMTNNSRGYLDGFSQGYTDGQSQQASLRSQLCQTASVAAYTASPGYSSSRYASTRRVASSRVLGDRTDRDYYYTPRERVDRGIGTTARRALMIAGGAAAGAGVGGAVGGKKGALIGALVGGGTGTALAYTKKPSRAFNSRISKKSVLTKTLIGAGAGAAIGALAGGKRGALKGVAIGGGGGALWSLMSGKRTRR